MSGRIDAAKEHAQRVLGINKRYRVAHLVVGIRAFKQGQYAAALPEIKQTVNNPIVDLLAALLSGWASYGAGDVKSAIATIDKFTPKRGNQAWYSLYKDFHAGLILDLANRGPEAGARLERAYQLEGGAMRVADAYARWLSRNRDLASATGVLEDFEKRVSRQIQVQDARRRLAAGERLPPLVDSAQSGAAEALRGIGAAVGDQGAKDFAFAYLQLALYLRPGDDLTLMSLGALYEMAKKPQFAIDTYRRIPTSASMWRRAQIQIATNLGALDRGEEGARMLRSLIADDPKYVEAAAALGNIERAQKKFADCSQTYTQVIDAMGAAPDKDKWMAFYYRGICEERSKQWDKAEADLRRALALQPEQPQVLNYLGYSLIDQGRNYDEALSMIRRSVAQLPNDGYIVDSLGWAYFRTGNLSDAATNLKRAAELVPADPTVRRHLGDAYWKQGLKSQARAEWTEAKRLNPEPQELAEVEDRIRDGLSDQPDPTPARQAAAEPAKPVASLAPEQPAVPAVSKVVVPRGRRVALVIGNSKYQSVPALANPERDSRTVADALKQVGFQSVTLVTDATRDKTVAALRAFATEADRADWALIYYAGHGIEVGGQNYLIPVDAKLASDRDVQYEAVGLEQVMSAAEGASKLRLVLLDACRDNPFANMMKRSTASRSVGRGLGQVEPDAGMLLVYAAKHGQIAFDGDGQNSPFVSSFIKRITTPQIEIRKLFDLVRDDVMSATKRQQQPFTYGSVPGSEDFYFLTTEVAGKP